MGHTPTLTPTVRHLFTPSTSIHIDDCNCSVYQNRAVLTCDATKLVKTLGQELVNYSIVFFHHLDVRDVANVSQVHATSKTWAASSTSTWCSNPRTELTTINHCESLKSGIGYSSFFS
jgi:hypothetical protein